jgi:hypothetical protein
MKLIYHRNRQYQKNNVGDNVRDGGCHVERPRVKAVAINLQIKLLSRRNSVEVEERCNDHSVQKDYDDVDPDADAKPSLRGDVQIERQQ